MKVAIVHDWYDTPGGAEKVIQALLEIYPDADLFALVDFFDKQDRDRYLFGKSVNVSFIQKLPFASSKFRFYLSLFPIAIEQFDLSPYDLVISSSHAVAKGVITSTQQLHISYIYSPMRYAWDMYHTYLKAHNITGLKALILKYTLHKIRIWDYASSTRVDKFVSISTLIQQRVQKYYRRKSHIIFPPVDCDKFTLHTKKQDYFITASRLVPYKKVKMIVEAFNINSLPLKVVGSGEEFEAIKKIAKPNIEIIGYCEEEELIKLMQNAKAFVYAAYEDFGIVPVEAMSCGTPVIAYAKGGIQDTVLDKKTGLLYQHQNIESLNQAIKEFDNIDFDYQSIAEHAKKFSKQNFQQQIKQFIDDSLKAHHKN
jgi:glycosyltransferase involved in cell wall biosynthesis